MKQLKFLKRRSQPRFKRLARVLAYTLIGGEVQNYQILSNLLRKDLKKRERAGIAWAALMSLNFDERIKVINHVSDTTARQIQEETGEVEPVKKAAMEYRRRRDFG